MKIRKNKKSTIGMWGSSTQKAVENFPISGNRFSREFIQSLAWIKQFAVQSNLELRKLDPIIAKALIPVCEEIAEGKYDSDFPVDIYQTGSGTSTNMNFNEVAANLATQILKNKKVHPNDHVNLGQSSNDVIPTAIHVTAYLMTTQGLIPALKQMHSTLDKKSQAFKKIAKIGRTHLQDATPISLGQEFSGYASQIKKSVKRIEDALKDLLELPIGGTAVGTGINTDPKFGNLVVQKISKKTGIPFKRAENPFEAQAARDACVQLSGTLKTLAVSLTKIASDLRFLASGPRCGIGEIEFPELQPGSSIMPGKVNPVLVESLLQVCARVIGNDLTITLAGAGGQLELNAMMPVMAHTLFESISLLTNAVRQFDKKCLTDLKANEKRIRELADQSLMLVTHLVPHIGYDKAAEIAKAAYKTQRTILEVAKERTELPPKKLQQLLDVEKMLS